MYLEIQDTTWELIKTINIRHKRTNKTKKNAQPRQAGTEVL